MDDRIIQHWILCTAWSFFFLESLLERKIFQKHIFPLRYNPEVMHSYSIIQPIFMFKCFQFLNCHFCYLCRNRFIWSYCICFYFMNVLFPKWSDLQSNLGYDSFVLGISKKNHLECIYFFQVVQRDLCLSLWVFMCSNLNNTGVANNRNSLQEEWESTWLKLEDKCMLYN